MIQALELSVIETRQETHSIRSVKLGLNHKFDYKPGQYAMVGLDMGDNDNSRPLSIASSPTEDFLLFSVKISESAFKKKYASLKAGDKIKVKAPMGVFVLDENAKQIVFLGGGIGITPFRSMIKYAADKKLPIRMSLIYSNSTPNEICYRDEWPLLEKQNPNLKVINTITNPEFESWGGRFGRISEGIIEEFAGDLDSALFYICGPPGMVDALSQLLKSMNAPQKNIRIEKFVGY